MKLRVDFGTTRREVTWSYALSDFPTAILFEGDRYEWHHYGPDPLKNYDQILVFAHMSPGDARWDQCRRFDDMFYYASRTACECGSIYSSYPAGHMFFCPMWRKQ